MKKVFLILITFILLVSLCIPIFAYNDTRLYYETIPADLGERCANYYTGPIDDMLHKYYIRIRNVDSNEIIYLKLVDDDNTLVNHYLYQSITLDNYNTLRCTLATNNFGSKMFICATNIVIKDFSDDVYIPVYCYNCGPFTLTSNNYDVYLSTITDEDVLMREYYNYGYSAGYSDGYDEGVENGGIALHNLPLVDNLTTFIASFTGVGTAQYITPLAICMILILIYILFIRWVLSLSKSDKLVKLTDIVVLLACICILVVMYIPMINLTITQHQIVENVETTVEETVRVVRDPITVVTDETGEIMYGPVGTVKILYESVSTENIEDLTESALSIVETTGG